LSFLAEAAEECGDGGSGVEPFGHLAVASGGVKTKLSLWHWCVTERVGVWKVNPVPKRSCASNRRALDVNSFERKF
jgi:hypothetical protein